MTDATYDVKQDGSIDPWSLDAIRVSPDDITVERVLLTVPVRRPNRREFFRVHPSPDYTIPAFVYVREDGLDRETFLVTPALRDVLGDDGVHVIIFTCVNRRGVAFLWPAKLPVANGAGREWSASALECAEMAKTHWIKMFGDRDLGAYAASRAQGDLGEPAWPERTLEELIKVAFKDRYIRDPDHDVIRELDGRM